MFHVTCCHAATEWTLHGEDFADTSKGEWGDYRVTPQQDTQGNPSWYASAPRFGCGNYQATPEGAIRSLLMDSGAFAISITPKN
jgi:hypothetical protein